MNASTLPPSQTAPADKDLAAQARPGHGVPSQDPNPAAQVALEPEEAERETKSVMVGGGVVGGAAIGATIGVAVAGPVGVVVGGALGAVAGALGGAAAGGMNRSP
jgi:non-heme chloroperoxidase